MNALKVVSHDAPLDALVIGNAAYEDVENNCLDRLILDEFVSGSSPKNRKKTTIERLYPDLYPEF